MKCLYFPKSSGKAGGIACYKVAFLTTQTEYLSQQPWKKSFILTHQFQGFQSILTRRHGSLASSMASRGSLFTCDRQEVERTELRQLEPSKAWRLSYTRQTPVFRGFLAATTASAACKQKSPWTTFHMQATPHVCLWNQREPLSSCAKS